MASSPARKRRLNTVWTHRPSVAVHRHGVLQGMLLMTREIADATPNLYELFLFQTWNARNNIRSHDPSGRLVNRRRPEGPSAIRYRARPAERDPMSGPGAMRVLVVVGWSR